MIIALLVAWILGAVLLALLIGGAVRVADQRCDLPGAVQRRQAGAGGAGVTTEPDRPSVTTRTR